VTNLLILTISRRWCHSHPFALISFLPPHERRKVGHAGSEKGRKEFTANG